MSDFEPKNKPVYVGLSGHGEIQVPFLGKFRNQTKFYLDSTTGIVVAFLEQPPLLTPQASLEITQRVKEGEDPMESYVSSTYKSLYNRTPNPKQRRRWVRKLEESSIYTVNEVKIVSELSREHKGRVQLEIEDFRDDTKGQISSLQVRVPAIEAAKDQILKGRFDQALPDFQKHADLISKSVIQRESGIKNRLITALALPDISAAVISIGSAHTKFVHDLSAEGYNISYNFHERVGNTPYMYGVQSALIRQLVYHPGYEPTEVQWYQAMVGFVLDQIIDLYAEGQDTPTKANAMLQDGFDHNHLFVKTHLSDMESVRRIERLIRERGFIPALESFPLDFEYSRYAVPD